MNLVLFLRTSRLWMVTGFFALFAFGGDIIGDAVADLRGDHCVSESSGSDSHHEKSPCSHCSCVIHNGSVLTGNGTDGVTGALQFAGFALTSSPFSPVGLPVAIDHPPQLG